MNARELEILCPVAIRPADPLVAQDFEAASFEQGRVLFGVWRLEFGWRGKKATTLTLIGFAMLLLAYVGTKFVIEILLGRV